MSTSRERVLAVLDGRIPDRVPWMESFISPVVAARIRGDNPEPEMASAEIRVPPDMREYLPLDNVSYDFSPPRFVVTTRSGEQDIITDGLLKTREDLKLLDTMPDPDDEALYRPAIEFLRRYRDDSAAMAFVRTGVSNAYLSMGIEHFSESLIRQPDLVAEILDRFCTWSVRVARNLNDLPFDLYMVPDDLGFTSAPMMSLAHFRKFCVPVMERLIASLRHPAIYHSDGNIHGFLEDIVGMGVAGIANIEPGPMDIERVKREFGDRVTLMGNVDLHYTLTRGTPEETRDEVRHLIDVIGEGGRYILASANSLPDYVRPENVRAMGAALLEFGNYEGRAAATSPSNAAAAGSTAAVPAGGPVASAVPEDGGPFQPLRDGMFAGDMETVLEQVDALLDAGHDAREIMERGLTAAMDVIGRRFRDGELFIPEVLLSASAMNRAIERLEPHLVTGSGNGQGKVLLGSVRGDMHSIGKNVVATMLRGAGYEVIDAGVNVTSEAFVAQVAEHRPAVLGLSSLLTSTMPAMENVIAALRQNNLRDGLKIMVGGAPVTRKFADSIGADGYATNAGEAVALVNGMLERAQPVPAPPPAN